MLPSVFTGGRMGGPGDPRGVARRWAVCVAVLSVAPTLSGCGAIAGVGSTVYSSGEALATIAKQAMDREGGTGNDAGDDPE